jgi:hypothetical protein
MYFVSEEKGTSEIRVKSCEREKVSDEKEKSGIVFREEELRARVSKKEKGKEAQQTFR